MAYIGFKKLSAKLGSGLAATIGRNKYGKDKFQKAAAKGETMEGTKPKALGGKVIEKPTAPKTVYRKHKKSGKSKEISAKRYSRIAGRYSKQKDSTTLGTSTSRGQQVISGRNPKKSVGKLREKESTEYRLEQLRKKLEGYRTTGNIGKKSGGLVSKLDEGGTVRKTRTTRGGKHITTEKINRPGSKSKSRYTTKTLPSGIVKKTTKEKEKTPETIYKEKEVEREYPSGVSTFKEKSVVKSRYKGEMRPGEPPRKSVTKQEYATVDKPRRKKGGLVSKLQNGGTSDDDKYGKTNKVVTKTKEDGVKTKEKSYTYKARSGHTAHVTTKKMKNRKAEPGEIKKSESFRGEVENRDDVDNPTIHSFESQKYKGGTKWSSKSYKKKTPEINIEDGRAGLPTLKSGGLVGKLQNGGLGIQSYDDNLKKGGLAKKARKKYVKGGIAFKTKKARKAHYKGKAASEEGVKKYTYTRAKGVEDESQVTDRHSVATKGKIWKPGSRYNLSQGARKYYAEAVPEKPKTNLQTRLKTLAHKFTRPKPETTGPITEEKESRRTTTPLVSKKGGLIDKIFRKRTPGEKALDKKKKEERKGRKQYEKEKKKAMKPYIHRSRQWQLENIKSNA